MLPMSGKAHQASLLVPLLAGATTDTPQHNSMKGVTITVASHGDPDQLHFTQDRFSTQDSGDGGSITEQESTARYVPVESGTENDIQLNQGTNLGDRTKEEGTLEAAKLDEEATLEETKKLNGAKLKGAKLDEEAALEEAELEPAKLQPQPMPEPKSAQAPPSQPIVTVEHAITAAVAEQPSVDAPIIKPFTFTQKQTVWIKLLPDPLYVLLSRSGRC